MTYKLIIGNRNYSSWSLRAWLYLTESEIAFELERIPLFVEGAAEQVKQYSPAGRVPILLDGQATIWDSLAIIEYVLESHPNAVGWPKPRVQNAYAKSICYEMHSGFMALRDELAMNIRAKRSANSVKLTQTCQSQVNRIDDIWTHCRSCYADKGPWLFGEFSIADVMYAPVALRFYSYSIAVSRQSQSFIDSVRNLASIQAWSEEARQEVESLSFVDNLVSSGKSPITLG